MQYDLLMKKPKLTIIVFTLITLVIAINALHIEITSDIEVYMPSDQPTVVVLNEVRKQWPVDTLMVYLSGNNLSSISHLKEMDAMEEAINPSIDDSDNVIYTTSIASLLRDTNANLPFGKDKIPDNQKYADFLLKLIPDEIKYKLISHDDKNAVIIVTTKKDVNADALLNKKIYPLSESAEGFKATPTGLVTMYTETVHWIMERIYGVGMLSLLLIVLALFAFHKDIKTVFIIITPVIYAVALTFGTLGMMNTKFPPTVVSVLPLLASLGVAYSLHMVNYFMELKMPPMDAIKKMINNTGRAVFLSTITTLVGFVSLLSSSMPPISSMGIAFLIGVFYSFIATMILVPAMLLAIKPKKKYVLEWKSLANLTKYRKHIILVIVIVSIASISTIPKISSESSVWKMMPQKMESNVLMHEYSEKFHSGQSGVIYIDTGKKDGLLEPTLLNKIDELEKIINVGIENTSAYSITDVLRKMNFGRLPQTKEEATKLFEKLPEKYRTMMIDGNNNSKTLIYVDSPIMSLSDTKRSIESVDQVITQYNRELDGYGKIYNITGLGAITVEINHMLMGQQMNFTFISLLLVYLCLIIVFRSFRYASLTMIPIILLLIWEPALLVLLNIPLNIATITVVSLGIGVGIDFAVHITERVREEIESKSGLQSIKIALTRKTPSLAEATIALIGGGIPIVLMEYEMITQFIILALFMLTVACIGSILTLASIYSLKNGKIIEKWR